MGHLLLRSECDFRNYHNALLLGGAFPIGAFKLIEHMAFHRPYYAYSDFDDRLLPEQGSFQCEAPATHNGHDPFIWYRQHDIHSDH